MIVNIYANYGMLAQEKRTVFTLVPCSEINERITVEIPEELKPFEDASGMLFVTIPDNVYGLQPLVEVLGRHGDMPAIVWYDLDNNRHHRILDQKNKSRRDKEV